MALAAESEPILLSSKVYVFDPRPHFPLRIVAKRYWVEGPHTRPDVGSRDILSRAEEDDRTLMFVHGVGHHKEHWEPTIRRLFEHERKARTRRTVRVHDAWSLDLPNHGDSAVLNEGVLCSGYGTTFPWEMYARSIHDFLVGQGTGVDVDFSERKLTLVGYSVGASVLCYPSLKVSSLHLIEPLVIRKKGFTWLLRFVELVTAREPVDVWSSIEAAYQALRVRRTFFDWDERILEIFVKNGLRPLPTAECLDRMEGVTLKCTRKQLVASCRHLQSFEVVYKSMAHVLKRIPTHVAYGAIPDTIPHELRKEVLHLASGGISNFASVMKISGVGHMMVQTHPDVVGDVIWRQLSQVQTSPSFTGGTMEAKL